MVAIEGRHWINGEFVKGSKSFVLKNPATGKDVVEVSEATAEDVEKAYAGAAAAQPGWEAKSAGERTQILNKWAALIRANTEELAQLEAQSMGRPVSFYIDAEAAAGAIEYLASLGQNIAGHSTYSPGQMNITTKQAYGVTGGIIPWNVPAIMFAHKAGSAVAAGNAIIIKTSEKAPLTSLLVARLSKEAGIPDGLIQVLGGAGPSGKLLSEHPKIRKISFTGSGRTGRLVMAAAAQSNLKSVTLELGGKSPTIIFPSANLEEAVPGVTFSIAWNSGQICVANSRLYVHADIYDAFVEKFKTAFAAYKHGDPLSKETNLGPQADAVQAGIVKSYLDIGNKDGKVILGGKPGQGNYIEPTIFGDVAENSRINKEEVFGPVVVVHKFTDEDDVIAKANDTEYGLYAAVYTQDIDQALRVAKKLDSGSVGVNCTSPTMSAQHPFGGTKASGIGRELGPKALEYWLEEKSIFIKARGL